MPVKIQQDNTRSHYSTANGRYISMIFRPPNSFDFNVLDLGFFNSIQCIQLKSSQHNMDELIAVVLKKWDVTPT